jgi:hypothetical protein
VLSTADDMQFGDPRDADALEVQEAARRMTDDRVHGHTRSGAPITDSEIEVLAAEAEAGHDVDRLIARRHKPGAPARAD